MNLQAARQWLSLAAQVIGLAGVIYEGLWEGGTNPLLLNFFGGLCVSGTGGLVNWRLFLQGFHFRIEVRQPENLVPTLLIDMGTLDGIQLKRPDGIETKKGKE